MTNWNFVEDETRRQFLLKMVHGNFFNEFAESIKEEDCKFAYWTARQFWFGNADETVHYLMANRRQDFAIMLKLVSEID